MSGGLTTGRLSDESVNEIQRRNAASGVEWVRRLPGMAGRLPRVLPERKSRL